MDDWIEKRQCIHRSALKMREILPFAAAWMGRDNIISKISQTQKEKYYATSHTYGI